jgi:four helix bundle protein
VTCGSRLAARDSTRKSQPINVVGYGQSPAVNLATGSALLACMAAIKSHRDLIAWQEAMRLVEFVYRETSGFPHEETFGLKTQLRRSAVSVPSNLAEGSARNTTGELVQFLGIARGSLAELETQLELAVRLGFLREPTDAGSQVVRVGQLLSALLKSLQRRLA